MCNKILYLGSLPTAIQSYWAFRLESEQMVLDALLLDRLSTKVYQSAQDLIWKTRFCLRAFILLDFACTYTQRIMTDEWSIIIWEMNLASSQAARISQKQWINVSTEQASWHRTQSFDSSQSSPGLIVSCCPSMVKFRTGTEKMWKTFFLAATLIALIAARGVSYWIDCMCKYVATAQQ